MHHHLRADKFIRIIRQLKRREQQQGSRNVVRLPQLLDLPREHALHLVHALYRDAYHLVDGQLGHHEEWLLVLLAQDAHRHAASEQNVKANANIAHQLLGLSQDVRARLRRVAVGRRLVHDDAKQRSVYHDGKFHVAKHTDALVDKVVVAFDGVREVDAQLHL